MALTQFTTDVENIQALSDTPNETEGLTADQLKKKFDDAGIDIKAYINDTLIDEQDTINADVESRVSDAETSITALEQRHILTAAGTQQSISADNDTQVTLTQENIIGDKLSVSANKIVIGAGVSYVKISAKIIAQNAATNSGYGVGKIFINSTDISRSFSQINTAQYANLVIPFDDILYPVSEGDTIGLTMSSSASVSMVINSSFVKGTRLTVEVVE